MNYVKVESSQIAEIGYEPSAGTEPGTSILGIKLPPNKKQQAAGLPGSEYTYDNVAPSTYRALMAAESIGSYFGKNIKSHPDAYPCTKVEADPPEPAAASVTRETSGTSKKKENPQPSLDLDGDVETGTTNPSTALAVIDTLAPEAIFAPGNVDSILVKLREQVLAMAKGLDPSTPAKQKRIRDVKGLVASQRTFVEKARKGYVADLVAKKGLTDSVSKVIQGRLSDIESEILEVTGYAAWEQGEKEFEIRTTGMQNRLANMGKEMHLYTSCAAIEAAIKELEGFDTSDTRKHKQSVERIIEDSLRVLKPELARRQEAERNAAELSELRRKQAEREESDRQAEAKRQEQARIDAAVQEKLDAAVEAAKVETRKEVVAEWVTQELVHSSEPEDSPELVQAVLIAPVSTDHKQAIHDEVVGALNGYDCSTRQGRIRLTQAIVDGLIPHVSITY